MRGYCLKVVLFRICIFDILVMTFGLCLYNSGVYTSRYVPTEGQYSVIIHNSTFGMSATVGTVT